jgi:hypothetical protein
MGKREKLMRKQDGGEAREASMDSGGIMPRMEHWINLGENGD